MSLAVDTFVGALAVAAWSLARGLWKRFDEPVQPVQDVTLLAAPSVQIERANRELDRAPGPKELYPPRLWGRTDSFESRVREEARSLDLQSRLDRFRDGLEIRRNAHRVLGEFQTVQAKETVRLSISEKRCDAELALYAAVNRVHHQMTMEFLTRLDQIEALRPQLPSELLDALKERAFEEYTERVNLASKHSASGSQGERS
jgi:hypothetical protein